MYEERGEEVVKGGVEIPLVLENVVISVHSPIKLHLIDWERSGLRIGFSVDGIGYGRFNKEPYPDRETALKEYERVLARVRKGNYILEICGRNRIKLVLIDSK